MPRDLIATYPAIPLSNDIPLESFYGLNATPFIIFIMKMTCVCKERGMLCVNVSRGVWERWRVSGDNFP